MRYLKKMIKKNKKKIMAFCVMTSLMVLMIGTVVFAGEPTIVKGTKNLFKDATGYVVAAGVIITTFMAAFNAIKYITADKEEKPGIKKHIINIVIGGILVTTMSGTITWILGYYSSSSSTADAILIASRYITTLSR